MASKGKGIAKNKRKRNDDDKSGGNGKRKNKNNDVLQFFEDAAAVSDDSDSSFDIDDLFDDDDFLVGFDPEPQVKSEPGRSEQVRVFPKEEELSGDELETFLEERYKSGSGYVRYAEDGYDNKRSVDRSFLIPSVMEPTIWKVKCKVGRERHTVFCLMQKYVDLKGLGTKLQIISAFAVEHIKGFVFVEAEKQIDVVEACNQLADVYYSLMTKVPPNEVSQLLVVRQRYSDIKEGMWARVKTGIYRGDIAQVVAVNNDRKRATLKLIPRVDMQALVAKYQGGGTISKRAKGAIPAARLISSSELEEFRPLMQSRRDRDTGKVFEFLDGLMLKDGFLYKKVSIDSLSFWDVNPSEEELQKFSLPSNDDSDNVEWLSQLYGEEKKKNVTVSNSKGGGKGEGSSGSNEQSSFEVHDLVLFGKREFGIVIGMEKDENYKILKYGSEGSTTLNLGQKDLKYVPLDKKFTALDAHNKTISVNDTVKVLHGPSKDRQGIVKQIYRAIVFLYDENDFDNAYFCVKSQEAEKVRHIESSSCGKVEEGPSSFEDVPSSPKSPLSMKKPWQMREDERRDTDGMFSVGQSLRIRIGPLKGYLCKVLAVRFSDVTVKLDSQHKVLTVKREHLSEVSGKSSATSMGDDSGLTSAFKPFDLLGSDSNTNDWLQGGSGTTEGDGWNVGGLSGERSAWPAFTSSGALIQAGTSAGALPSSVDNDSGKGVEDDGWLSKANNNAGGQGGGWGKCSATGASSSWESVKVPGGDQGGSWKAGSSADQDNSRQADPWDKGKKVSNESSSWGKQTTDKGVSDTWNKEKGAEDAGGWGGNASCANVGSSGWGKQASGQSEAWGKSTDSKEQNTNKPGGDTWGVAKASPDVAENSWSSKAGGSWGNKNSSNENNEWKNSAAASVSQSGGWGQAQEQDTGKPGGNAWGEAKATTDSAEDSWGKAAGNCGNKNESSGCKSSATASEPQAGGWGQASGQNASGGWKNNSSNECPNEKWSKSENASDWEKGGENSHWNKPEGSRPWDQLGGDENNQGYRGRGFGGRRGRGGNRGGYDQSGRGRGGSFGRGQSSSWSQENQNGSSWHSVDGSKDQGSDWGKNKSWSSNSEQEGKGWSQSGGPMENNKLNSREHPSERSSDFGGWKQPTSWAKDKSGNDENSSWGKSTWGQNKGSQMEVDKATEGTSSDAWGKAADNWGSSGSSGKGEEWKSSDTPDSDKGWGKDGGDTQPEQGSTGVGWKGAGGWKSSGDDGASWSKPKSFDADGLGGNESWQQSKSFDNDRGFNSGRGFGGRGRGRDGRGRGRSFDRGGRTSWNKDGQDSGSGASWSKDQGGSSWGNSCWSKDSQPEAAGSWSKNQGGSSGGNSSASNGQGNSWGNQGDSEKNPAGGWSKGGSSDSGGWSKGNDGGSWSKPGSDTLEKPRNFENDQGFGRGRGRRGRGGFRGGGRDQSGRGKYSSWKNDDKQTGSSWGNASGGDSGGGNSWSKGWSNSGGDNKGNDNNQAGSSWSNASGGNDGGNSWSQGRSNSGGDDKGQNSGWGKAKGWNDSAVDNESAGNNKGWGSSSGGNGGNTEGKTAEGTTSWGACTKSNDQGSSWGKAKGWHDDEAKNEDKGSAVNADGGGSSSWGNKGGSSWGGSASGGGGGWA